jgi:penicillin-binding protein 2
MSAEAEARRVFTRRAMLLGGVQAAAGAVLVGRMAWLAIAEQDRYALAAEDNRVAMAVVPPRRGWIVDSTGEPLAQNRPAYAVELIPSLAGDLDAALARIAAVIPLDAAERARLVEQARTLPPSAPLPVADDIGWDAFAALNISLADQPGLRPVRTYVRAYPDGPAFGHVLGYVGRPSARQYEESRDPLYLTPGFRVGKDGVERSREEALRGVPGARRVEVNARGRVVRELEARPDTPGQTVQLTLDRGLQAFAAERVGAESVSVVVIDCLTGDIKCMLSMPAFDPNIFSSRIPATLWNEMQADETKPLLNKVTQGLYVPGSTFKMVTALAALAEGVPPSDQVGCGGRYRVGRNVWHCHRRGGHGSVDMQRGIAASCNVYFYTMARRAGPDAVAQMAHLLGLGERFDIPMPVQRQGIVPEPDWLMRRHEREWTVADTLNTAIGQGYLIVNPLQLAVMTARIATGLGVAPRLEAGTPPVPFAPLPVRPEDLEVVRRGMDDVVNGPGGTARSARLRIDGVRMGGKTGTAQVRRISAGFRGGASVARRYRDHALFVAFAPVETPRYAVSVVVEHGISGSRAAAPIARDVLTYIYDREQAEKGLAALRESRERARRAREEAARQAAAAAAAASAAAPEAAP